MPQAVAVSALSAQALITSPDTFAGFTIVTPKESQRISRAILGDFCLKGLLYYSIAVGAYLVFYRHLLHKGGDFFAAWQRRDSACLGAGDSADGIGLAHDVAEILEVEIEEGLAFVLSGFDNGQKTSYHAAIKAISGSGCLD